MKNKLLSLFLTFVMVLGLMPGAVFASDDTAVPFTPMAGDQTLSVTKSTEDYTYTVVTNWDENWNPIATQDYTVDLYVVDVPADVNGVTLDFGAKLRLAYGYDANGGYIAAYAANGAYENNGQTGEATATIPSNLPDFVRVQTPYDASWNSNTLYAITFHLCQSDQSGSSDKTNLSIDALLTNIAASYAEKTGIWDIVSSGMYETAYPEKASLDDAARQARVDAILATLEGNSTDDGTAAKAILALRSLGYDPEQLTAADGSARNAVTKLTATTTTNIYNAPYVLLAYQQGEYDTEKEQSVLTFILDSQNEDGSWVSSPDTTGIILAAIATYAGDTEVDAALAAGVDYLKNSISEQGTYGMTWGGKTTYNANSTAMAVIGLSAAGTDPSSIQHAASGISALDGLFSYALEDNSGFGYTDNAALNTFATKDGFWALISASKTPGYSIFDFTSNDKLPAAATPDQSSGEQGSSGSNSSDKITVFFELKTHRETWIEAYDVTVDEDSTVADVFYQVLDGRDGFSFVDKDGYISSITYESTTWGEFDAGRNSGWKYMVNGVAPGVGMNDKILEDGDQILWYYITDYIQDTSWDEEHFEEEESTVLEMPFTDVDGHWAYNAIESCYAEGLMSGTGDTTFSPDAILNRGMVVTILHAMEGKPTASTAIPFDDVASDDWYTDAVAWASEEGIVSGYGNGAFGPEDNITREQLAAILLKYSHHKGCKTNAAADLSGYTDFTEISIWAQSPMEWAVAEGLISGRTETTLAPLGQATRAEMATILTNYVNSVK